jgi:hypothetical protein
VHEENRIGRHASLIREWFVNDGRGIEQGWTIAAPPLGAGARKLTIGLEVRGLRPQVAAAGVSDADGELHLRHEGFLAWDATGRELDDRSRPRPAGLALAVDDEEAR